MRVTGSVVVERSPAEVWNMLLDPAVLERCVPGCEKVAAIDGSTFSVALRAGVGLLKGRFRGRAVIEDSVEHDGERRSTLAIDAAGTLGTVTARTSVRLRRLDGREATEISHAAEVRVGGALAAVGTRLLAGGARRFQEEFFRNLTGVV